VFKFQNLYPSGSPTNLIIIKYPRKVVTKSKISNFNPLIIYSSQFFSGVNFDGKIVFTQLN